MNRKFFIDNGYLEFKNLLSKSECKKLNNKILKIRKLTKKFFLRQKMNIKNTRIKKLVQKIF